MSGVEGASANNSTPRSSSSPELSSPPHSPSDPGSPAAQQLTTEHRNAQISSFSVNTFGVEGESEIFAQFFYFVYHRINLMHCSTTPCTQKAWSQTRIDKQTKAQSRWKFGNQHRCIKNEKDEKAAGSQCTASAQEKGFYARYDSQF